MAAPVKIDDAATLKPLKPTPVHLIGSTLAATLSARAKLKPIRPGVERWPVKTGTDEDVASVQTGFVDTTVEELINEPRPHDMRPVQDNFPSYQSRRAFGVETTIYRLEAEIIAYKMESDGDYHLVIQGDTGNTMIAECPKPDP